MARSKKEIDKELMYKKLMPTATAATESSESVPVAEAPIFAPPPIAMPVTIPVEMPSAPPAVEPSAAAAIVSGEVKQSDVELVNIMELLVNERIDAAMDKFRCCTCDKCKKDVTAITLNKLVPCYIVSSDDTKRTDAESKFAGQVATGLVQAILTVKARPTHE